jgi:hypothetical protein
MLQNRIFCPFAIALSLPSLDPASMLGTWKSAAPLRNRSRNFFDWGRSVMSLQHVLMQARELAAIGKHTENDVSLKIKRASITLALANFRLCALLDTSINAAISF